jgi:DNA repair photolyase
MIKEIQAKTILTTVAKPDPWFGNKYNMNIYRGCQHQCIYCDSRSECYQIENFQDILVKINAPELLEKELSKKKIVGSIGFGAMSDPYLPVEKKYQLTRQCLQIIQRQHFPIHIITKSALVTRDRDILQAINKIYAAISFTITTADDELAKKIEPYAPLPSQRLKAMRELSDIGIYTGVTMMPILPFIEDNVKNIRTIVEKTAEAGGKYIIAGLGMTLRDRQREYYYQKLDENFPGLKEKYIATYGNSYGCMPRNSKELYNEFYKQCKKYGIATKIKIFQPVPREKIDLIEMF